VSELAANRLLCVNKKAPQQPSFFVRFSGSLNRELFNAAIFLHRRKETRGAALATKSGMAQTFENTLSIATLHTL
jgi:hypothetical protein